MNNTLTFEEYLHRLNHTKQTIKTYLYSYSIFIFDNPDAKNYNYKDIVKYINKKSRKSESPSTKIHLLHVIKKYYDYLIETGKRNNHPCKNFNLRTLRRKEVIHQDLFTTKELELLMQREERYQELEIRNKVLISLLIYQGLSSGEIEKLNINNINLDKGTVFIKSSRKMCQRHLHLTIKQLTLFEKYINRERKDLMRNNTDALILGKLGNRITVDDINYLISTYKILFPERNLNPGTIRQSVISNWLNEKNLPLEQVQLMSGQRWISSTVKYRHNSYEKDREIMNKFFPLK